MTSEAIPFPLDYPPESATLTYRPWGTRTLKLKVSANSPTPALRIRPRGVRSAEAQAGIFRAFADDSDVFVISWGGGHEPGPCLKSKDVLKAFEKCTELDEGDVSIIFFNVTHTGPDIPEKAAVTIEAYDEKTGDVFAALPVTLQKPANFPDNAVQIKEKSPGIWQPQGEMLAVYDPRWWPRDVAYESSPNYPLSIHIVPPRMVIQWEGREIATIADHSKPSLVGTHAVKFELFAFDAWNLALRIWFFWLDANIGKGHEAPDAERFDLLIRRGDGRVTLACTDLHWRETWGEVKENELLQATIGLSNAAKLKLIKEGASEFWAMLNREEKKDHNRAYNPVVDYVPRRAEILGKDVRGNVRGKGLEAHLPNLENVLRSKEIPSRMTSSDVRLG